MTEHSFRTDAFPVVSCRACQFYRYCGGLDGQAELFGCFASHAGSDVCRQHDWTCPCRPKVFHQRWREVGVRWDQPRPHRDVRAAEASLPLYIPRIVHGSSRARSLSVETAALSLFDVLQGRGDAYAPVASSAEELRRHFRVRADARILVTSVAQDRELERYWAHRRKLGIPEMLSPLGLLGVTVPNFSFFGDAPKPHNLWNRTRMLLVAEELSSAGLSVVPHLHALTSADWAFWAEFLKAQPSIRVVTKEFQTGNKAPDIGMKAIEDLERLQSKVQRPLHPILVAGARFLEEAARAFDTFTIVDSVPFMAALRARQVIRDLHPERSPVWETVRLTEGEPVDALLQENVDTYSAWLQRRLCAVRGLPTGGFQLQFGLRHPGS